MAEKLTLKQKRFANNYIKTGNATASAIKAGYSKKTARAMASENLTKPYIKDYIDNLIDKKDKKTIASQNEVLEFYTNVLRGIEKDIEVTITGKEKEVTPRIKERIKAADALAKRYGIDKPNDDNDNEVVQIVDDIK